MPRRNIPAPVPPGHKWCFQCAVSLPFDAFSVRRGRIDGYEYACRPCIAAKKRTRTAINAILHDTYRRVTGEQ